MPKSILIVDDEQVMREFLADVLEDFEIDKAVDGEDAIKKLSSRGYDLLITDMKMPKVSGEEVVKFAREKYRDMSIIVISGYSSLSSVSSALEHGVSAFLSKPFAIKQLRLEVEKALESQVFSQSGGVKQI